EELTAIKKTGLDRLEGFAKAMLERGDDAGRVQIQADLWAAAANEEVVRARFSETIRRRRALLRGWIEESVAQGDMREVPANALASIVLALGDALMLHSSLDPSGFQWRNVRTALSILLEDHRPA
ncbi:MAG: TetR family transcriptional regulator C-terminal domain-containing protein, partial [Actinomycetota bacterium]